MMKIIPLSELYEKEYSVKVLNALAQSWREKKSFSCFGAPKPCHMLLYLEGEAIYQTKDGGRITAKSGDTVYLPMGAEYTVRFLEDARTVHINFLLTEEEGGAFALAEGITVLHGEDLGAHFYRIDTASEANLPCHAKIKALTYGLFAALSALYRRGQGGKFALIAEGISVLEEDSDTSLSIADIAAKCHVSEVYFRKLFKEYAGVSPSRYRMELRVARAKAYLRQGELSVSEISDRLGFSEVSYFIRIFKEYTGQTPKQYKNSYL